MTDRLAAGVEELDILLAPTAAQRVREMVGIGIDGSRAVESALVEAEARARRFRSLLCGGRDGR